MANASGRNDALPERIEYPAMPKRAKDGSTVEKSISTVEFLLPLLLCAENAFSRFDIAESMVADMAPMASNPEADFSAIELIMDACL